MLPEEKMELDTMTEIDTNLLQQLPCGLLTLDSARRITWLNGTAAEILGVPVADLGGRRLAELPESVQPALAAEPQLYFFAPAQRWLRRELRRSDAGDDLLVLLDVTAQERLAEENARLRQQVEDLTLTDGLTGLPNKRAISQALDLHVSRSRRYGNPLSIALVYVDMQALAGVQPLSNDPIILAVSRFLRDRLRWVDQIARWEDNIFLLVLPETADSDARNLLQKIHDEQHGMQLPEPYSELRPPLSFGLGCWQKGDDTRTLLRSALEDLRGNSGA
jgi:diguanylate cyclase (GGDEF)-like protein